MHPQADEVLGQVYARLDIVERALNDMRVRTVLEQRVEELMTTKGDDKVGR